MSSCFAIVLRYRKGGSVLSESIYYWQVPMPEWDFPIRITKRFNCKEDIQISDWSLHWHEHLEFQFILKEEFVLLVLIKTNGSTAVISFLQIGANPTTRSTLKMRQYIMYYK